jgi:hypothetical protein
METEEECKKTHLTSLPPEILLKIISNLSTYDILKNIALVSRLFNALSNDADIGISVMLSVIETSEKAKTYMIRHAHQITDVDVYFTPQDTLNGLLEIASSFRNLISLDIWNILEQSSTFPPSLSQLFQYGRLRKFHLNGIYPAHSLDQIGLCRHLQDLKLNLFNQISFEEFQAIISMENLRKLTLTQIPSHYLTLLVSLKRPKLRKLGLGVDSYERNLNIIANCFTGLRHLELTNNRNNEEITIEGNDV